MCNIQCTVRNMFPSILRNVYRNKICRALRSIFCSTLRHIFGNIFSREFQAMFHTMFRSICSRNVASHVSLNVTQHAPEKVCNMFRSSCRIAFSSLFNNMNLGNLHRLFCYILSQYILQHGSQVIPQHVTSMFFVMFCSMYRKYI